jgi:hypothetical protein
MLEPSASAPITAIFLSVLSTFAMTSSLQLLYYKYMVYVKVFVLQIIYGPIKFSS